MGDCFVAARYRRHQVDLIASAQGLFQICYSPINRQEQVFWFQVNRQILEQVCQGAAGGNFHLQAADQPIGCLALQNSVQVDGDGYHLAVKDGSETRHEPVSEIVVPLLDNSLSESLRTVLYLIPVP